MPKLKKSIEPTIEAMFEQGFSYAMADMKMRNRVHPGFFARLPNGRVLMIACTDDMMASIATKMNFAMVARKMFREKGVTHYVYISEIWIASAIPLAVFAARYDPRVQADRFEGLMMIAGDHTQTLDRIYFTVRNGSAFDSFKLRPEGGAGGGEEWFWNLLQDHPHPRVFDWLRAMAEEQ